MPGPGDLDFWANAWDKKKTGWHTSSRDPNNELIVPYDKLIMGKENGRILVPLCGKSGDLLWLAKEKGHTVIGIEGVESAAQEFFEENSMEYNRSELDGGVGAKFASKDGSITILASDFFAVTQEMVGPLDLVYDRGALVALPANIREPLFMTSAKI